MAFDTLNRYSANHKPWDHVGNIIPDIEHSEGERPAFEFKVASWLPVEFYDKYYENWMVVMPGKPVALDPDGCLMPAQYGLTSATVAYTASDVAAGVIDVATGLPVTTAKTVTLSQLTGVREAGWTAATAGDTKTSGFMGRQGVAFGDATAKYPIGIAPYPYLQWAGGDGFDPTQYRQHNYNMQHQVAVLCDYVIKLPLVPASVSAESVAKSATASALVFGTNHWHIRGYTQNNATGRYDKDTGVVPFKDTYTAVALALANYPLAQVTFRTTPVLSSDNTSDDLTGVLVNEVTSLSAVRVAGDYFIDYPVGVIFIYSADGATLPTAISGAAGNLTLQYYHYKGAASTVSKFASVVGASGLIKPGDFLKTTTNGNLTLADPSSDNFASIIGQVLGFETYPRDGLDRVKTAFNPVIGTSSAGSMGGATAGSASANLGQMDRMPGSATEGMTDQINFAGAANTLVIINLVSR